MVDLRPYQFDAKAALNEALATTDDQVVVSIPTAGGKTIIFAVSIWEWLTTWAGTRVCILAHRRELLTQAEDKLKWVWPEAPTGVWSAALNRREGASQILIAGIQSVYRRACDFEPFDIIIVDEAHLVPTESETMYRRFLSEAKLMNPNVRIIGFTATPYRLDGGSICGPNRLFNRVCYSAPIRQLIDDGYLCKLRTKATSTPHKADGVGTRNGDYIQKELENRLNNDELVSAAVKEIVEKGADRKSWLIFCCGVKHAEHVSRELAKHGIHAPVVIGDTDGDERNQVIEDFDAGRLRAVVNVNCLTTGLDVTRIDLIAVLRPTKSTSLWIQMVGRGFRLHPDKVDTLILDFGENCLRHGPIDDPIIRQKGDKKGEAPVKVCPECDEIVPAAARTCPECGYEFPPPNKTLHSKRAAEIALLSEPWDMAVEEVEVEIHEKINRPPSLQVTYYGVDRLEWHRQWLCFELPGTPGANAARWWERRFGAPVPETAEEAVKRDLFLADHVLKMTESITVRRQGKYTEVVGAKLRNEKTYARIS